LDEPRVESLVSQIEPCRVAQHVRVDAERELRPLADGEGDVIDCLPGERPPSRSGIGKGSGRPPGVTSSAAMPAGRAVRPLDRLMS
jgi:hypothetical protein